MSDYSHLPPEQRHSSPWRWFGASLVVLALVGVLLAVLSVWWLFETFDLGPMNF